MTADMTGGKLSDAARQLLEDYVRELRILQGAQRPAGTDEDADRHRVAIEGVRSTWLRR